MSLVVLVAFLTIWEISVRTGQISVLFFPAPSIILHTLVQMTQSGELATDASATLSRLGLGLSVGGGAGLALGLMMGWSARLRLVVDPFIAAIHPIPKISILPLILILFGIDESSKIILIAIGCFFPMLINTMAGVRQINPIHFEVAQNFGASSFKTFTKVVWPGSLPLVLTGARLAFNVALVLTISVELLTARTGLGATIWLAWETLRTEELYVSLLIIAIIGISSNFLLQRLSVHLMPWQMPQEL